MSAGRRRVPTDRERRQAIHRAEVQVRRAMDALRAALEADVALREREAAGERLRSWRSRLEALALVLRARRLEGS